MTKEEAKFILANIDRRVCDDELSEALDMAIKELEQEPKIGHWIFRKTVLDRFGNTVECSSCHKKWKTYEEIRWKKENKYCPNCGAKMAESEDKEV